MSNDTLNDVMRLIHEGGLPYGERPKIPAGWGGWVCPTCNRAVNIYGKDAYRWRWNGTAWEHYHDDIGEYIRCLKERN